MQKSFHSGFVTLLGRSNVGKSTLMNTLVGEKVSIVSNKPQTTRNQIRGVLTRDGYQMVFIDTPGLHKPQTRLGEYMNKAARSALEEVDAVLLVVDASESIGRGDMAAIESVSTLKGITPVILLLNKIDIIHPTVLLALMERFKQYEFLQAILPISARRREGIDELEKMLADLMPEGPKYFPDDMYTDQPENKIATELIREQTLKLLRDEIPHGIGIEIIQVKTRENGMMDMDITILVEKDSHKGMIIGKKGAMLKAIGSNARTEMEALFGNKINLQLWVKVKEGWRDSPSILRELGYSDRE